MVDMDMVDMVIQVPNQLAEQIRPFNSYLPTVLQLTFLGLRTPAVETATEIIEFLSTSPSAPDILNYHVSERAQGRLQRLLALNTAGLLSPPEQLELDEMEKLEHVIIMLKTQLAQQQSRTN